MNLTSKKLAFLISTVLSTAIFSATAFSAEPMLSTGGYATQLQKMTMMKMIDGNGDHTVTLDEFNQFNDSVFNELDSNQDGVLDANEWVGKTIGKKEISVATGGYSQALRNMKMMAMMDSDGDHKVTKEEFIAHQDKIFTKLDTSSDQSLSAQEWAAKGLTSH